MDYYAVLGVRRDASSHEIKAAYRRQAMKWHPDRVHAAGKGASRGAQDAAAARFRAIAEAYEVMGLGDSLGLASPSIASQVSFLQPNVSMSLTRLSFLPFFFQ
ncbi:unnamed protein product [Closterium sp. Yama58-4]|nr:unnamed protein product [Closterium sp. Yama58-4]